MDVKDLTTNKELGRLTIQVYNGIVPRTAENFLSLCQQRRQNNQPNYTGSQFFRIIPGLFCLGGDVEYSNGLGGVSATPGQRYFNDENYILSHNAPGMIFKTQVLNKISAYFYYSADRPNELIC